MKIPLIWNVRDQIRIFKCSGQMPKIYEHWRKLTKLAEYLRKYPNTREISRIFTTVVINCWDFENENLTKSISQVRLKN